MEQCVLLCDMEQAFIIIVVFTGKSVFNEITCHHLKIYSAHVTKYLYVVVV